MKMSPLGCTDQQYWGGVTLAKLLPIANSLVAGELLHVSFQDLSGNHPQQACIGPDWPAQFTICPGARAQLYPTSWSDMSPSCCVTMLLAVGGCHWEVAPACCAVPCRAVSCRAVPCRAVPCRAVPCHAVPCRAVSCCHVVL